MRSGKVTLAAVLLLAALTSRARAQVLTVDVGIPLGQTTLTVELPTAFVPESGYAGQVTPLGKQRDFLGTTVSAGDIILVNPTGGNDPSNWAAAVRFFNPLDPTGSLGLPATVSEAFFPANIVGGFAAFALFPKYNLLTATLRPQFDVGSEFLFGPLEGISGAESAIVTVVAYPAQAVPEPSALAFVGVAGVTGAAFLRRRRRRKRASA